MCFFIRILSITIPETQRLMESGFLGYLFIWFSRATMRSMIFSMPLSDFQIVCQWWSALFLVGVAAYPLTKKLFTSWFDRGYLFSKAVGMAVVTYLVYLAGTLHVAPFTYWSVMMAVGILFVLGVYSQWLSRKCEARSTKSETISKAVNSKNLNFRHLNFGFVSNFDIRISDLRKHLKYISLIVIEELVFFIALLFWSWVKAHEPNIEGLEKFMDFGFMQSLYNSQYFPAPDMWWAGGFINYYFFGHLVTAVLTKLSGLDLSTTFNLMLVTLFALTLTMSFSIGVQLQSVMPDLIRHLKDPGSEAGMTKKMNHMRMIFAGLLTSFLVTLAGNMQTIYAFTKGYVGEDVVPFWTVLWKIQDIGGMSGILNGTLLGKLGEGLNRYWYANATRFIPFTIHEFPSYSFVVSDVHGHVLAIPFALLAIALLVVVFSQSIQTRSTKSEARNSKQIQNNNYKNPKRFAFGIFDLRSFVSDFGFRISDLYYLVFFGFLLGILLMTNALSGPIYGALFVLLVVWQVVGFFSKKTQGVDYFEAVKHIMIPVDIVGIAAFLTALPFLLHFKSFATGIGVNCPSGFLADTKIGPFLFEGVEKCQKSPLWMMTLLWGFFWFTGIWLFIKKIWTQEQEDHPILRTLKVFFLWGIVLIIIPEFFYVKDIYPAHFRSNTMFKLGYEAFILWSIVAAYVIVHFIFQRHSPQIFNFQFSIFNKNFKFQISNLKKKIRILFFFLLLPQLFLVSIYPIFSVRSYFGELKTYKELYGLSWLEKELPDDFRVVVWLRNRIQNTEYGIQNTEIPVIVEAPGDSYTHYNHVSAFSGIPTILGWGVHEWLWRGNYDVVAPRDEEVRTIYTSENSQDVRSILEKYSVRYIVVGQLEREKYPDLREDIISQLATPAFESGDTVVYEVRK